MTELKTVVLGDQAVQVAVTDVAAIEAFKTSSTAALKDAQTAHAAAIAAKDEEIGTLKAQLKAAQDAADVDIDSLVAARSALVTQIKALDASIDVTGKTDAELRRAAVVAKMGDVKDASDAEIAGMFRVLAAQHHPVGDVLQDGLRTTDKQMTDAWSKSVTDLNAWRKEA